MEMEGPAGDGGGAFRIQHQGARSTPDFGGHLPTGDRRIAPLSQSLRGRRYALYAVYKQRRRKRIGAGC